MANIDKAKLTEQVIKLQNGDGKAFEEIYNMTVSPMIFVANGVLKNKEDAEDVVQDAFVKVLEKIGDLEKPETFYSWMSTMVVNLSKNLLIKNNRHRGEIAAFDENGDYSEDKAREFIESRPDEDDLFKPEADVDQSELRKEIMGLINDLSENNRTVVYLHYYNDMSVKEIAESLGTNENTVKSRLFQARKQLEKGILDLEKKNKKILGVAPVSLVVWALKVSAISTVPTSVSVAGITTAAGVTTAAAVSGGTTATSAVASGVVTKIIAGAVIAGIVAGGAVAGTKVHNRRKAERTAESSTSVTDMDRDGSGDNQGKSTDSNIIGTTRPYNTEKSIDSQPFTEEGKYGVVIMKQGFAVTDENGTSISDANPSFNRKNFHATYEDLLPAAKENRKTYSDSIDSIYKSVNSLRSASGEPSLRVDDKLTEQANVRAEEIAWSAMNNSVRPDGTSYTTVFDHNGMKSGTRLESRAYGFSSADEAMKVFAKDKSILSANVESIGVGVSKNPETEELVFVIHLYSAKESGENSSSAVDQMRYEQDKREEDTIDNLQNAIADVDELDHRIDEAIDSIPVIGELHKRDEEIMDRFEKRLFEWEEDITLDLKKLYGILSN